MQFEKKKIQSSEKFTNGAPLDAQHQASLTPSRYDYRKSPGLFSLENDLPCNRAPRATNCVYTWTFKVMLI